MSIVRDGYEKMIIDVQIKALPRDYKCHSREKYYYDCDTKIFNVVKYNLTLNPVVLILVDIEIRKVFCILLTRQYVSELMLDLEKTKRIFFDPDDEFSDEKLMGELYEYNKVLDTDTEIQIDVKRINKEICKKKKIHHSGDSLEHYSLVYKHSNIRGYLSNFIFETEKPVGLCLLCMYDSLHDEREYIQLKFEKSFIHLNRSRQRTSATDADIVNILYEIALCTGKEILFKSAGVPVYLIDRTLFQGSIWRLRAEEIEKDW